MIKVVRIRNLSKDLNLEVVYDGITVNYKVGSEGAMGCLSRRGKTLLESIVIILFEELKWQLCDCEIVSLNTRETVTVKIPKKKKKE